ncbi:MAG: Asp-tRNA(Asn)/Glu-tRNA(Gln) amidotransferase subunit GatC, partial [Anaerolineae bacterium]
LRLSETEADEFGRQLGAILQYVEQICGLEDDGGIAAPRPGPARALLRRDIVTASLPRETVLANAPESESGQFRVPPVLE